MAESGVRISQYKMKGNEVNIGSVVPIAGFPIHETTSRELSAFLSASLRQREKVSLLFANCNFVVRCAALRDELRDERVLIVNDGVGLDIAARLLRGRGFKANLNGTDFTPYWFRQSARPLRVFLLGGRPQSVRKAAAYVSRELGQEVVGWRDGYASMRNNADVIERINRSAAEVLLVALGNPLQEEWILRNRELLDAGVVAGVGALFDFWSGDKIRAPKFLRDMRMEWLFRLCQEPRRLLRRYTIDMPRFFAHCAFPAAREPADGSRRHRKRGPAVASKHNET